MTGKQRVFARRRRIIAAAAVAATLPVLLGGCFNGFDAQTSIQQPSGDGLNTAVGNMMIRNAVWVRSKDKDTTLTLSATLVNVGKTEDTLLAVTTVPKAFVVGLTGAKIKIDPISEVRTAYNSDKYVNAFGMNVPQSGWVETTFRFEKAGSITGSVLVVPPTGIYAGINPGLPPESTEPTPRTTAQASVAPTP